MKNKALSFLKNQMILCLLIVFIIVLAILRPSFVSLNNIKNVLVDASIYGVAALAMTMAIITGAFDLSMAANFAWGQIFFCYLLNAWGDTPMPVHRCFHRRHRRSERYHHRQDRHFRLDLHHEYELRDQGLVPGVHRQRYDQDRESIHRGLW